mgnify:FL=1
MSRFRTRTASSPQDRQIAGHLDRAARELEHALQAARDGGLTGGYRQRRVERELGRVLAAIQEVGSIAPKYGGNDPDYISEDERNKRHRERLAEERAARKAAVEAEATEVAT